MIKTYSNITMYVKDVKKKDVLIHIWQARLFKAIVQILYTKDRTVCRIPLNL